MSFSNQIDSDMAVAQGFTWFDFHGRLSFKNVDLKDIALTFVIFSIAFAVKGR